MQKEGMEPFLKGQEFTNEGRHSEIFEIQNNPKYIAKEIKLDYLEEKEDAFDVRKKRFEENIKLIKDQFNEFVPEFHVTYGEANNPNEQVPYVFMKKVERKAEIEEKDIQKYIDEKDKFLSLCINMYSESFDGEKGNYLDLGNYSNYVYGSVDENPPRLFFVDVYPVVHEDKEIFLYSVDNNREGDGVNINGEFYKYKDYPDLDNEFPLTNQALEKLNDKLK